jgi:hypothetical protein
MPYLRTAVVASITTLSLAIATVAIAVGGHHEATTHSSDESAGLIGSPQQSTSVVQVVESQVPGPDESRDDPFHLNENRFGRGPMILD